MTNAEFADRLASLLDEAGITYDQPDDDVLSFIGLFGVTLNLWTSHGLLMAQMRWRNNQEMSFNQERRTT